jgi:hypothetical protein
MGIPKRPTLLPPLPTIYSRLSEIERERKELQRILRLALDRQREDEQVMKPSAPQRRGGAQ